MRTLFAVVVAASALASPVWAAPAHHPKAVKHETGQSPSQASETADAMTGPKGEEGGRVIILEPQLIPNPYANPEPRMISDAWAVRT